MTVKKLGIGDLAQQFEEFRVKNPNFSDDDLFVLWFLRAYITDNESEAARAVTGGSNDKGIDAVLVDPEGKNIFLVQSKYRAKINAKPESRNDVLSFVHLADFLTTSDKSKFDGFITGMDPYAADLFEKARSRALKYGYRVWLYYVSTGRCSGKLRKEAQKLIRKFDFEADLEIIGGSKVMSILQDYLDGVAPPIPTLDLVMEGGAAVKVNGILQRFDINKNIESWVFSMNGDHLAGLFRYAGTRLFARNIRGFLGEGTAVNVGMKKTIATDPDYFYYYNNGITIVCDGAEKRSSMGSDILRVRNPQIINGQQTTRVLAASKANIAKTSVLVKVIQIPRDPAEGDDKFDTLISRIVAGTNWQNAIKA